MTGASAVPTLYGVHAGRTSTVELVLDEISYATRELWRSRIVLIFTFVLPLAWLLIVGALAGEQVDADSGAPVMQFVTPAAALMGIMFAAFPPVARSLAEARERHLLKRIEGSPVPTWMYLVGRVGGAVLLSLASVIVMFAIGMLMWDVQIIWRTLPATIVTLVVGIATFAALGLAVGALSRTASFAQTFAVGAALAVSFVSGLFTLSSNQPDWMTTTGNLFPPIHILNPLLDQFSPALSGSGWEFDEIAAVAVWGVLGLAVAAWAMRREPRVQPRIAQAPDDDVTAARNRLAPISARTYPRPTRLAVIVDQTIWSIRYSRRDLGWVVFAVGMPVALYGFMTSTSANAGPQPFGMPFAFFFACAMAVYGIGVTAFVDVPNAVAGLRDRLVLKRLRGTPLDPIEYMAGRTAALLILAVATTAIILAIGMIAFGINVLVAGLPVALLIVILGTLTLAACGYAFACVLPNARATAVVGLAILLPLSFVSDIFVLGDSVPAWFGTVGSLFPLRHFVHALAGSLNPAGMNIDPIDIAVMALWLVVAGAFAIRRWRWEPGH